jgi:diguanylate cyclase (GGDEF)-like protein
MGAEATSPTANGNHFSCSMTAVLLARVRAWGGDDAVAEVLRVAGSRRRPEYLSDIANWICYDEAVALWAAGARVTHHPQFSRALGEEAARRLNASPVAALLRSLGSPENVYRQIATTSGKFSQVLEMKAVEVGPGFADITATPVHGFPRAPDHCAWTRGLLTQTTVLFGLSPATVHHEECAAFGAPHCHYRISWEADEHDGGAGSDAQVGALREQLEAMKERLHSMFATASDLIDAGDISDVLARIADRAAIEVRAPRYLLAVRTSPDEPVHCHHKGFDQDEAERYAERILEQHPASLPESWLVVPVRSKRQDYGRLLAMYDREQGFFPQERELIEVYARYAASALDGATSLVEAKRRYAQSSALLELARALAAAGTSAEVARRLSDAVPAVVDCDRVAVHLWDASRGQLVRAASTHRAGVPRPHDRQYAVWTPRPGGALQRLLEHPEDKPIFIQGDSTDPALRRMMASIGARSMIAQPLAAPDSLLGLLTVAVARSPERLKPTPDLLDRLSGVAAQATIALQNGRLVDQMTHQALHDQLTGLPNRLQFTDKLRGAIAHARSQAETVTLFYVDLDGFKPVNDEFGHDAGDQVLVDIGERLKACLRGSDTVARLGGDEFAVLIDGPAPAEAVEALADRLREAFAQPFSCAGKRVTLGASIGRAVFPHDADDAESLLRLADAAMFEAKRTSRPALRAVR